MIYRVPDSKAFHSARWMQRRSSIIVRVALVVTRCFIRSTMIRTRNLPVIDHPFVTSPCFLCWRFYLTSFPVFRVDRCFDMLNGMDLHLYYKFSCVNYLRIIQLSWQFQKIYNNIVNIIDLYLIKRKLICIYINL